MLKTVFISDATDAGCRTALESAGLAVVAETGLKEEELIRRLVEVSADGLIVRSATKVTAAVLEGAKGSLKVVGRAGTGVDNIDVAKAKELGIRVLNTPAGNSVSAAELTCGMMMALSRHVPQAAASMKEGRWDRKVYMGSELSGKTLAIVGLGHIGRLVATRMQAFGMETIGYDPLVSAEDASKFGVEWVEMTSLWPRADYVTLHVPLIAATREMVSASVLSQCKRGVRLVNVARGGLMEEDAVAEGLESGQVGGVALDVYLEEPPTNAASRRLVEHPKVIATPHLGASTKEAQTKVALEIAQSLIAMHQGKPLSGVIA